MDRKILIAIGAAFIVVIVIAIVVPIVLSNRNSNNNNNNNNSSSQVTTRASGSSTSSRGSTGATTTRATTLVSATTSRAATTTVSSSSTTATYASSLTSSSPYVCYRGFCSAASYFIEPVLISVPVTGTYQLYTQSSMDTFGFLYQSVFDIRFFFVNLMGYDDDSNGNGQFKLQTTLQANTPYIILVSTYDPNVTGAFTLVGSGAGRLTLTRLTNLKSITFAAEYNISSALTTSSSRFCRNSTCANPNYYYQAISFNATVAGYHIIVTNSRLDSFGLFYNSTFTPTNPKQNLVVEDDDSAGDGQFAIVLDLRPGIRYTIVVTSFDPGVVGAFILTFYCSGAIVFG